MVTTINSLPPEILFLILEFASSQRSEVVSSISEQTVHTDTNDLYNRYLESNTLLASTALVSKEWTYPSQSLLLSSIVLSASDRTLNKLLRAPLSQLPVHQLNLPDNMGAAWQNVVKMVGNLLPRLIGLKSLFLEYNGYNGIKHLNISTFLAPSLSELQHLTLRNLFLHNRSNCALINLPFKLKRLDIVNVVIPDVALKAFITPNLRTLTVMQVSFSDQFSNALRLAAPHIKSLYLKLHHPGFNIKYIPIIPLCISVIKFHFFVFQSNQPLLEIISAFSINQLLLLKLAFLSNRGLPDLLMLLHQPSLQNLQSFDLVFYKTQTGLIEDLSIPLQVSEECCRRGILYKYEIINNY